MKGHQPSLNTIFKGMDSAESRNRLICQAHREYGYNASAIARELNVHRSTVGRVLKQYIAESPAVKLSAIDSPVGMRIVEHALNLLMEGGRENLSLRRLAMEMDMSATNLYNYFNDKNDLLDVVRVYGFRRLLRQVKQSTSQGGSSKERLQHILDAYFNFGLKQADLYEIMFSRREIRAKERLSRTLQEEVKLIDDLYYLVRGVLQEFLTQTRKVSPSRLREAILMLWSQMHGLICLYIGGNFIYMSKLTQKDFWATRDSFIDTISRF